MDSVSPVLGNRTAIGSAMLVGARLIARLIDLVTMLVLARLLSPSDFGRVAIALSVVSIAEAALEMPVNQALVRLSTVTQTHYNTAFTISLLRGFALTIILLIIAVPVAWTFEDLSLIYVIFFLSFAPAIRGMVSPRLVIFQKDLSFWRDVTIELGGKIIAFGVAIGLAITTESYWAIAAGTVSFTAAMTILSYIFAPHKIILSLSEWRYFLSFIGWISAGQLVNAINWQFERLLVGKLQSIPQLGVFAAASDLTSIPFQALFAPSVRPLLAAFSQFSNDHARLATSYQTASACAVALGLPLLVGQCLMADAAVHLVLGRQWLEAVPLVRWLSLSLIPALFAVPAGPLIMALNQNRLFALRNGIECCIKIPFATLGILSFGLPGIVVARFISELAVNIFICCSMRKLIGLSLSSQLIIHWRCFLSTTLMVPFVMWWRPDNLHGSDLKIEALQLALAASGGATVYFLSTWILWCFAGQPVGPESVGLRALRSVAVTLAKRIGLTMRR